MVPDTVVGVALEPISELSHHLLAVYGAATAIDQVFGFVSDSRGSSGDADQVPEEVPDGEGDALQLSVETDVMGPQHLFAEPFLDEAKRKPVVYAQQGVWEDVNALEFSAGALLLPQSPELGGLLGLPLSIFQSIIDCYTADAQCLE